MCLSYSRLPLVKIKQDGAIFRGVRAQKNPKKELFHVSNQKKRKPPKMTVSVNTETSENLKPKNPI